MLFFPRIYPSANAAADCEKLKDQGFANAAVQERRDEAAAGQRAGAIMVDTPVGQMALLENDTLEQANPAVTAARLTALRWIVYALRRSAIPVGNPAYRHLSQVKGLPDAAARDWQSR